MYTLFTSPGACSMAVHVTLYELNVPFEAKIVNISQGQTRTPEFLALNPKGAVPVLVDNGVVITQSAAIMIYLSDKHKSDLLPPQSSVERAKALEWLLSLNSELHPAHGVMFFTHRLMSDHNAQVDARAKAKIRIQRYWDDVEKRLEENAYLAGPDFSLADILLSVIHRWSVGLDIGFEFGSNLIRVTQAIKSRPSFLKAATVEGVVL